VIKRFTILLELSSINQNQEIAMSAKIHPSSVLFITLDSCRHDSFVSAHAPNFHAVGRIYMADAPSYFKYGSHAAMFVGFTPGVTYEPVPLLNPKFGKIFKLAGAGFSGKGGEGFLLEGRNIVMGSTDVVIAR
jgi:hypothetical protein